MPDWNWQKLKQHCESELLTNMPKRKVCLCQWDYIFSCNENENDNRKIDHINKT